MMNVDAFQNDFYHLLLVATATIAGTFHSPAPLHTPIAQETLIQTNTRNIQQEVSPTGKEATASQTIVTTTKTVSISHPSPTSVPLTPTTTEIKPQNLTIHEPTPVEKKQEITLNIPTVQTPAPVRSLNPDILLQLINAHRESLKLPALVKDEQLCKLAEYRKPQLYDEIFTSGNVHKGLYDLNLPYYITENMAHYSSEQAILNWWLGSYIHKAAIEGNSKYSCGACSGDSCAQLFTNYTPKG